MKPQSEPSTQEVLAGLVERVTYHNEENGFCVLRIKARGHRELVTVVGHAAVISAGEWITASGGHEAEVVLRANQSHLELDRNFNNIRVRSFVLTGAPISLEFSITERPHAALVTVALL
jgi:hypothetical protein